MIESIEVNRRQLQDVLNVTNSLGKNGRIIQVRALNRTAKAAVSKTAKDVTKEIALTQKVVKAATQVKLATQAQPESSMTIAGKPIRLIEYGAKQTKKGVSFKIRKSGGRERYRHAFIATMKNDADDEGTHHEGVFERNTTHANYDGRLPIKEKYGPSIPNVFEFTPGMTQGVLVESSERLVRELDGQLQRLLDAS